MKLYRSAKINIFLIVYSSVSNTLKKDEENNIYIYMCVGRKLISSEYFLFIYNRNSNDDIGYKIHQRVKGTFVYDPRFKKHKLQNGIKRNVNY